MDQTILANVDNVAEQKDVEVVEVAMSKDVVSMIPFKNHKNSKYIYVHLLNFKMFMN